MRLWLWNEDIQIVQEIAELTGLSQVEIMSQVMHAGISAIKERKTLILPLTFAIVDAEKSRK